MSSQEHQLHLYGDNADISGSSLDFRNSGIQTTYVPMFKPSQQGQEEQQQPQQSQLQVGSYGNMGMPSQQQLSNLYGSNMGGGGGDQQGHLPDFQLELKRLNQQLNNNGDAPSNALLLTGNNSQNSSNGNNGSNNTSALIQSLMLDQSRNMGMQSQQNLNSGLSNTLLQPGFFQDHRILIAQNHLANIQRQHDVALPSPHSLFHRDGSRRMRGGVIEPFPEKLHRLLTEVEAAGRSDVISWVAAGRAFVIHKPDKFFKEIVPLYFRQSRLSSFKRQLNLYGYELINSGPARGGYFHELFVKDHPDICRRMRRVAVKIGHSKGKDTELSGDVPSQIETHQTLTVDVQPEVHESNQQHI